MMQANIPHHWSGVDAIQSRPLRNYRSVVVLGHDTMIPKKGPGAGKQVVRPFTDIWAKRSAGWQLIARQATIAAAN